MHIYSKWIEVCAVKSTKLDVVMRCLRSLFARFGLPNTLVSDNGPYFVSAELEEFLERNGIQHVTASPYHPSSNGLAERAVQIVKNRLRRCNLVLSQIVLLVSYLVIGPHLIQQPEPHQPSCYWEGSFKPASINCILLDEK